MHEGSCSSQRRDCSSFICFHFNIFIFILSLFVASQISLGNTAAAASTQRRYQPCKFSCMRKYVLFLIYICLSPFNLFVSFFCYSCLYICTSPSASCNEALLRHSCLFKNSPFFFSLSSLMIILVIALGFSTVQKYVCFQYISVCLLFNYLSPFVIVLSVCLSPFISCLSLFISCFHRSPICLCLLFSVCCFLSPFTSLPRLSF